MPILRFHAVDATSICKQSEKLVCELAKTLDCTSDLITLEVIDSSSITNGQVTHGYPVIEVLWFDRGQAIQDAAAKCITKYVMAMGHPESDIIFTPLIKSNYYENGEHF